jgi:hypothetical protein
MLIARAENVEVPNIPCNTWSCETCWILDPSNMFAPQKGHVVPQCNDAGVVNHNAPDCKAQYTSSPVGDRRAF